jgi:hypothetical protein
LLHCVLRMHFCPRHVLLLAVLALPLAAENSGIHPVTVVLNFKGPYSARSLAEMKQEMQGLVKDAGVRLDWKTIPEAAGDDDAEMIVVQFNGTCILQPVGYLYDERGPLAYTYSSDGKFLPFSEVSCDKVTASIRSAMFGGDFAHADLLLGRALGRVVAHELIHVLSNSGAHGRDGVYGEALNGKQLITNTLPLSPEDLQRIQVDRRR